MKEQNDSTFEYLQAMYNGVDKKIDTEIQSRAKNEEELRAWIESKFQVLDTNHKSDEQAALERERNLM